MESYESATDVGRRFEDRVLTLLTVELVTIRELRKAYVENLSPCGAGLRVDIALAVGSDVILLWPAHDIAGNVSWVDGCRCGIAFSRTILPAEIDQIIRTNGGTHIDSLAGLAKSASFFDLGKI